jgi:uncharacterized RDD family membrane protein YckC
MPEENQTYAGLGRRVFGLFVDFCIFCALFFPITRIVKGTWIMSIRDHRWHSGFIAFDPICAVFLIIIVVYFILLEGLLGVTIGKLVAGTRVVDLDGRKPGLGKSIIRNVLRLVDGLPAFSILGAYLIWKSPECTRLGDKVARTRVIRVQ